MLTTQLYQPAIDMHLKGRDLLTFRENMSLVFFPTNKQNNYLNAIWEEMLMIANGTS